LSGEVTVVLVVEVVELRRFHLRSHVLLIQSACLIA
jgi:hypothetical protein